MDVFVVIVGFCSVEVSAKS